MESKNYGTVICGECGTRVSIDDAEASYNAELDDVVFYCSKCIYNPAYLPAVSDDSDEAVEQMRAADTLPRCEISRECYFGQDGCCLRGGECR